MVAVVDTPEMVAQVKDYADNQWRRSRPGETMDEYLARYLWEELTRAPGGPTKPAAIVWKVGHFELRRGRLGTGAHVQSYPINGDQTIRGICARLHMRAACEGLEIVAMIDAGGYQGEAFHEIPKWTTSSAPYPTPRGNARRVVMCTF